MASKTVKIAISLPQREFQALEQLRKRLGRARSALIAEAVRAWLDENGTEEKIRRYLKSYRLQPESAEEIKESASPCSRHLFV